MYKQLVYVYFYGFALQGIYVKQTKQSVSSVLYVINRNSNDQLWVWKFKTLKKRGGFYYLFCVFIACRLSTVCRPKGLPKYVNYNNVSRHIHIQYIFLNQYYFKTNNTDRFQQYYKPFLHILSHLHTSYKLYL